MWGIIITVFLGLYCLMCFYIGRRGWTTLARSASCLAQTAYWIFFSLLVVSFPASEFFQNYLPEAYGLWLSIIGGYSMVAVSYTFLILLLIDILRLLDKSIGFIPVPVKEHKNTPLVLSSLVIASVIIALSFGSFNANNPVVRKYELMVGKKAGSLNQLKIVMVSDIHYGPIVNGERLSNMVKVINDLRPDIVMLAGDIIEGSPREGEAQRFTDTLGRIKAAYGIFAVPGNHDRGLRSDDSELSLLFKNAGINVLKDNYLSVEDSFYVIGRNDPGYSRGQGRKELEELIKGVDSSKPLFLLDHQPIDVGNAQKMGVDLQLSGHTHKGQVFPIGFITSQVFELDWGLLNKDAYHLIVSSGFGTWGPPLRIGTQSEIVSITVKFND